MEEREYVLQERVAQLEELVRRLSAEPLLHASVVSVDRSRESVTVSFKGALTDLALPSGSIPKAGDVVRLSGKTEQIVDIISPVSAGRIGTVTKCVDDGSSRVEVDGGTFVVFHSPKVGAVEVGDDVVLDSSGLVVLDNLGKDESRFSLSNEVSVSWDDVGGLENTKRELREAVEHPHKHRELMRHYGQRPVAGVLLWGPPGCGKTLLGKAAATAQSRLYNGADASSSGFIYVKGPEILERWVGVAEAHVRGLFARARAHHDEKGYPALIFIDEADAILGIRGRRISSDTERTIVPMFLSEMSGFDDSSALVVLATNRPDELDRAVIRDGRIDLKLEVPRPDCDATRQIASIHVDGTPLAKKLTREGAAALIVEELFDEGRVLYEVKLSGGEVRQFTLGGLVSGAMVEGAVNRAKRIAIRRDETAHKPSGVSESDFRESVGEIFEENVRLRHEETIREFVEDFSETFGVTGVRRLRQASV